MEEQTKFQAGTIDAVMREKLLSNNVFSDWLHPSQKESRQILEQFEMDKVEPTLKMQGLKAAGINPLTAASGLAGSGGSSPVPQPAESANPIGDVAGAVGSVAGAAQNVVGAVSGIAKLPYELKNLDSDTAAKLAAAGLSDAQTQGVLTDNTYKDEDWITRLNVQRQQFDNMKQELTNMFATHREIMTHCDEMISQIELNGSLKDYHEALMARVEEKTRWLKELNDWRISHNLHITESGIDGYIFDMALNGVDISKFDNFIEIYSDWRGRTQRAVSDAQNASDVNAAFDKAFNAALGSKEVEAAFKPYLDNMEVIKETMKALYADLAKNPGNPFNFATKLLNFLLFQIPTQLQMKSNGNNSDYDVSKPDVSPKAR